MEDVAHLWKAGRVYTAIANVPSSGTRAYIPMNEWSSHGRRQQWWRTRICTCAPGKQQQRTIWYAVVCRLHLACKISFPSYTAAAAAAAAVAAHPRISGQGWQQQQQHRPLQQTRPNIRSVYISSLYEPIYGGISPLLGKAKVHDAGTCTVHTFRRRPSVDDQTNEWGGSKSDVLYRTSSGFLFWTSKTDVRIGRIWNFRPRRRKEVSEA